MDRNRPSQRTQIPNFFMAGSYTYQDYIDSMEGATKSALLCADVVLEDTPSLVALRDGAAPAINPNGKQSAEAKAKQTVGAGSSSSKW